MNLIKTKTKMKSRTKIALLLPILILLVLPTAATSNLRFYLTGLLFWSYCRCHKENLEQLVLLQVRSTIQQLNCITSSQTFGMSR